MASTIGGFICKDEPIIINEGLDTVELIVENSGDRSIQIGSHFHFFEVNSALEFDREKAFGMHLDILSGTAVRFEPGQSQKVQLTQYRGTQTILGFNDLTNGCVLDENIKQAALKRAAELGFIK